MEQRPADSGLELILDNRKIILGFVLLMALCGAFFVFGFVEGKRQALRSEAGRASVTPPDLAPVPEREPKASTPDTAAKAPQSPPAATEQLEWYKKVNQRPSAKQKTQKPEVGAPTKEDSARQAKSPAAATSTVSPAKVTYSVQVGAFRQRREAETTAAAVKGKGYDYVIESPGGANRYFLLKVGRFESRAEAVALQLRLKEDGFTTLIKTNE